MKMDIECIKTSDAVIMAHFLWLYQHSHGETKESHEHFNQGKRVTQLSTLNFMVIRSKIFHKVTGEII
jgi:hypothetical protein